MLLHKDIVLSLPASCMLISNVLIADKDKDMCPYGRNNIVGVLLQHIDNLTVAANPLRLVIIFRIAMIRKLLIFILTKPHHQKYPF